MVVIARTRNVRREMSCILDDGFRPKTDGFDTWMAWSDAGCHRRHDVLKKLNRKRRGEDSIDFLVTRCVCGNTIEQDSNRIRAAIRRT